MPPQYLTPKLNMVMKTKPNVVMSTQIRGRHKRRDIIAHDELYIITDQGRFITIAVIDEDISHFSSPRYTNTIFSQRQSAENAVARLNKEFNTQRFEVKTICLK